MTAVERDRAASSEAENATARRLVWDWPVRIVHWGLVISILGAFITNRLGVSYFAYHAIFGYTVIVLVAFRIFWGFVGPKHARFSSFVKGPKGVLRYIHASGRGWKTRHAGHNPLGAAMVLLLLGLLAAQAAFGLFANDEIFEAGPFAGLVSKSVSLDLTSLHRRLFYLIAGAAALHIGAVLWHWRVKGDNLIAAMIHGKKPAHLVEWHEEIRSSRGLRAIALVLAIGLAFALLLHFAPPTEFDSAGL
jgi:cytochrome b